MSATLAVPTCNSAPAAAQDSGRDTIVRFHLSLNVSDLAKSITFYMAIFGCEPAKCRPDYAKFEINEPPLVLSLEPHAPGSTGMLNHAGFRFPSSQMLVDVQRRLEMAGMPTQREEGVECCYSRQTKFWARDPDNCLWEFYVLEEDIQHRGAGQSQEKLAPVAPLSQLETAPAPVPGQVFEHRMGAPLPERFGFGDETADEVRLRGTLNLPLLEGQQAALLEQAFRALRPGGQLQLHVLTASAPFKNGSPTLDGPAAVVKAIPVDRDVLQAVEAAGFAGVTLTKFKSQPCFRFDGIEMRETMIAARKPMAQQTATAMRTVVYRGPFASVTDETGRTFRRGERQHVPAAVQELLAATLGEQFTTLETPAGGDATHCG